MNDDVFISYAAKDRERVLGLVKRLRNAGVSVWIDQGGIDISALWSQEIVNAIKTCKVMLLSISPQSTESKNVVKERHCVQSAKSLLSRCILSALKSLKRWNIN